MAEHKLEDDGEEDMPSLIRRIDGTLTQINSNMDSMILILRNLVKNQNGTVGTRPAGLDVGLRNLTLSNGTPVILSLEDLAWLPEMNPFGAQILD
jgi:hypothetical protein